MQPEKIRAQVEIDKAQIKAIKAVPRTRPEGPRVEVKEIERPESLPTLLDDAYYGPIGDAVRKIADYTEADPAAIMATLLVYCGALIGPNTWLKLSGRKTHASLFILLVGLTSLGRKGTSHFAAKEILGSLDSIRHIAGINSGEALVTELADESRSNHHVVLVEEEFARLLGSSGRSGSTLSPMIRLIFDGEPLGRATVGGSEAASDYHVSMLGHITPEELHLCLSASDQSNGLANRVMMVATHASKVVTWDDNDEDNHPFTKAIAEANLAELASRGANRKRILMTDGAFAVWSYIRTEGCLSSESHLLARLPEHLCRIALIYAVLDGAERIDVEHFVAAYAFITYVRQTTEVTYPTSPKRALRDRVLLALHGAGNDGLTQSQLANVLSNHTNAAERAAVCAELETEGLITVHRKKSSGRTAVIYSASSTPLNTCEQEAQEAKEGDAL